MIRQYDSYGVALQGAGTSGYAFTGREWDAEIGLYYYRARYYDPKLGRFISEDPMGTLGGINLFQYVGNRTTTFTDPIGLWGIQIGGVPIGQGDPWLIFDNESWMDISKGAAATFDGIVPFADPFAAAYAGDCNPGYRISRMLGAFSRDVYLGARIPNLSTWLEHPVLYEIGQKTLPLAQFEALEGLSAIERGRAILQSDGWFKALLPSFTTAYKSTVGTGLTPGAWLATIGVGQVIDTATSSPCGCRR